VSSASFSGACLQIPVSVPAKRMLQNFFRTPDRGSDFGPHLEAFLSEPQYVARRDAVSEKPEVFPSLSHCSARSKYKMSRLCAIISSGSAIAALPSVTGAKGFQKPGRDHRHNRRPQCPRVSPSSSQSALSRPCRPARNLSRNTLSSLPNPFRPSPSSPANTSNTALFDLRRAVAMPGLTFGMGPVRSLPAVTSHMGVQTC
jgi:hypothetical protein